MPFFTRVRSIPYCGLIIRLRKDTVGSTPTRPTIHYSGKIPGVPPNSPKPILNWHFGTFPVPANSCVVR